MDKIIIKNARENNLKNISLELPKNKLIVMTGVSGSGKSSLAFDTIYAEGQRRYVESLSAYARQFLGNMNKPDVDSIEGLSPSISIDQKSTNKNPRSSVGTVTEIYDYLRLLYARIGIPYCPVHKIPVTEQSFDEMTNKVMEYKEGTKIEILAPVVRGEKGTHKDLIESLKKDGYVRVRIDEKIYDLSEEIILEKNIKHKIDVIIDRIVIKDSSRSRIFESIEIATKLSNGKVIIVIASEKELLMSENYSCPYCDFSIPELEPRLFSFNSPYGACNECKGLGVKLHIDEDILIPDKDKSIMQGAIVSFQSGETLNIYYKKLALVAKHYKIDLNKPIKKLKREELDIILYGSKEKLDLTITTRSGSMLKSNDYFEGIISNLERRYMETVSPSIREWIEKYMTELVCPVCQGARLKSEALSVKINNKNIYNLTCLSIRELIEFFNKLKLNKEQKEISFLVIKEINERLSFLKNVGLEYLTLSRGASTLSGGEAQRIRLATQIGSRLSGVLYVLDEPSIGLHQKDNEKLINSLKEMRDLGNTLIVVEHDIDTMLNADYIVDIGPKAGAEGGYLVAEGTPKEIMNNKDSITGAYLSGREKIDIPLKRRKGNKQSIKLTGCKANNLKNIDVEFPLGKFICVTGVSGSGKSTLVNEILSKILMNKVYKTKDKPGEYKSVKGIENIDKVINISQDPIGRTPRSNPSTYVGVFDAIRDVFAQTKDSKIHGYDKSRFSFNVKGGRCEACLGDGVKKIEMHFLPDVYVPCDVCHATRYNNETLKIKFKNLNIAQILDLRVHEALTVFENVPKVYKALKVMDEVGLGYVKLGQNAVTLSGGEASRVKLAKELQKKPTGKSIFILDEPSTGLHSDDIKKLLLILNRIVDNGDTVIVIEHNLD
ncbi:MAG: excinuclease ABC subunit UvrA, partial [Tenericutes bacterium]|nr:excinuclease ABC subunit UvrA [Mycoplasmatota bacterium]